MLSTHKALASFFCTWTFVVYILFQLFPPSSVRKKVTFDLPITESPVTTIQLDVWVNISTWLTTIIGSCSRTKGILCSQLFPLSLVLQTVTSVFGDVGINDFEEITSAWVSSKN